MSLDDSDVRQGGFQDTTLKPAPKKIIICCDGTWQSSVTNVTNIPSNVTRLARYLVKVGRDPQGQEWQQLVYYDAGIGTGVADLEAKRQGGTGSGFVGNVIEAYNFIVLNHNPGDRIFCFGFSRGAYTARAVAGLVNDIGVIQKRDMQDFPELYRLYQDHKDSHTFRKSQAWREWVEGRRLSSTAAQQKSLGAEGQSWAEWRAGTPRAGQAQQAQSNHGSSGQCAGLAGFESVCRWEKRPHGAAPESTRWVEAVGVFDTVGSLGLPEVEGFFHRTINFLGSWVPAEKFGFHNVTLSPYIKHAYHAMALDEHRKPFDTTLWHLPVDECRDHKHKPTPKLSSTELGVKYRELLAADGTTDEVLQETWEDLIEAQMHEELKGSMPKLLQVWFPGVHINIGGGSDDLFKKKESDFEQIAMITLAWMVEQLKPHLAFEMSATAMWRQDRFVLMRPVVDELLRDQARYRDHWLVKKISSLLEKEPKHDPWNDGNQTRYKVLAADALTGWATGPIIDSYEEGDAAMKKGGSKYRTPGEYRDIKLTCEEIHPTVWYRMQHLGRDGSNRGYDPQALRKFARLPKASGDGPGYEWVKGAVRIPEYKIGAESWGFERSCVVSASAREFLGRLDKEYGIQSWEASQLASPSPVPSQKSVLF